MSATQKLTANALRNLAIVKIRLGEQAFRMAGDALERNVSYEHAEEELHLAAMRGEEAAKLLAELKKESL